jgi:Flp pilus assembly protein protease CpaA
VKDKSEVIPKITVIALVIIAFLLAISLLPDLYSNSGPNLVTVIGLFAVVIVCVALGSSIAFKGETQHAKLLLISLFVATGLVFLLANISGIDLAAASPGWKDLHPLAVYNLSVTFYCLLALSFILAIGTLAVLIHIVRAGRK